MHPHKISFIRTGIRFFYKTRQTTLKPVENQYGHTRGPSWNITIVKVQHNNFLPTQIARIAKKDGHR
jgi:hypothetical protein